MFKEGTVVTLAKSKEHFDGNDTLSLKEGVCGLIVRSRKKTIDHEYVVDFGAYGQWNCIHGELIGDDPDGWDSVTIAEPFSLNSDHEVVEQLFGAFTAPRPPATGLPDPMWAINGDQDAFVPLINPEVDIARRMAEIEKGIE